MDNNNKNDLLKELINKQIAKCNSEYKLTLSDIKRISNNIESSIFNNKNCCIWKGYITNENNNKRAKYINFYYNHKKIALHRLLYINYVGNLKKNEYIKYTCKNKGKCCNINHIKKISKKHKKIDNNIKNNTTKNNDNKNNKNNKNNDNNDNDNDNDNDNNIVSFD